MIYIISNTLFGFKNQFNQEFWFKIQKSYFIDYLIPFISKNKKETDILIHLGNFFNTKNTLNTQIINEVQYIFDQLSSILPVYILVSENDSIKNININTINVLKNIKNINIITKPTTINNVSFLPYLNNFSEHILDVKSDYLFCNNQINPAISDYLKNNFKKVYNGISDEFSINNNIKYIGSPYNLKDDTEKGFVVLNNMKNLDIFKLNDISPKFKYITINKDEDMIEDNNIYTVKIDNDYYDNNKVKVDIFLKNNNIIKYDFIKKSEEITDEIINENIDIENLIIDELKTKDNSEELIKEFQNIKKLSNKYEI